MTNLIQKAIDQTERAKYGLCCEEAIHALDIANGRIAELQARLEQMQNWRDEAVEGKLKAERDKATLQESVAAFFATQDALNR